MTANVLAYKLAVLNVNRTTCAESTSAQILVSLVLLSCISSSPGPPVQHVCDQTCIKTGQGK